MFSRVIHISRVLKSLPHSLIDHYGMKKVKERIMELTKDCSLYPGHGNIYE